jgi:DNA polymerase-3 subunit gamma/tau
LSLALARKYRPSTFADLVGQDSVSQTLSLALDGDRLSHAYLFSGLRGSGKTSTARIFAKALLCEEGASSQPCNHCDNCNMANESRHMDIIEMDAASNRGIDDIKELIEHTKYKPGIGRYKIFIIDEVHMLTTQAFNALLKTLEEPPDFVKFILATTDPLKLPATILSRTQHFRFKKIPQKLVLSHLEHILNLEGISYEKEALDVIARSGAGSLRDSLTLLDQAIVYSKNHVDMTTVTSMLGIIEPSLLDTLLKDMLAKDEGKILDFIKLSSEYESEMVIDELTLYLKELLFAKDNRFTPLIIDRFFRVLADAKELLALGSEGEFVLSLTLFKMMESLAIKDIDTMIRTLQKELSGVEIKAPEKEVAIPEIEAQEQKSEKGVEKESIKEESPTPPSTAPQSNPIEATPSVHPPKAPAPTKTTPETAVPTEAKREAQSPVEQATQTPVVEAKEATAIPEPTQPVTSTPTPDTGALKFKSLIQRIYDRDYDLGLCFESNISYESFGDNALTWHSTAQDTDKKMLINHWSIIKMFVQELFGFETKIINIPSSEPKKKIKHPDPVGADPSVYPPPTQAQPLAAQKSTADTVTNPPKADPTEPEIKSSCIAPEAGDTEAAKEKDPSELLKEPMIKEMIELFDPKKVRIRRNS